MQPIDRLKAKKKIKTYSLSIPVIEKIEHLADVNNIQYSDVLEILVKKQRKNNLF